MEHGYLPASVATRGPKPYWLKSPGDKSNKGSTAKIAYWWLNSIYFRQHS
jgi:hypothetical protein